MRLNRLIPINERKVILKRKSDQKSRSENNRGKSDEKEKRRMNFFLNGPEVEAANLGRRAAPAAAVAARVRAAGWAGSAQASSAHYKGPGQAVSWPSTAQSWFRAFL